MFESPNLGIVISDFFNFDLLSRDFIFSVCQNRQRISTIEFIWKNPPKWVHNNEPLPLLCGKRREGSENLHLFTFPQPIPRDFSLDDLQIPFKISGIIFLVDLDNNVVNSEKLPEHLEWLCKQKYSGLAWAKNDNLPLVIVAIHKGSPYISIEMLRESLGLDVGVPIIPYHVRPENVGSHFSDKISITHYKYTYEYTQKVLSALVQQYREKDDNLGRDKLLG